MQIGRNRRCDEAVDQHGDHKAGIIKGVGSQRAKDANEDTGNADGQAWAKAVAQNAHGDADQKTGKRGRSPHNTDL